jgi:hypothetical protein
MAALWLAPAILRAEDVAAPVQPSTFSEYQDHLRQLAAVLDACKAQRSAAACNPKLVGPDNYVETAQGIRAVRFDWLRITLAEAVPGKVPAKQGDAADAQLAVAASRLAQDAGSAPEPTTSTAAARADLTSVLAMHRFQRYQQDPSLLDRARAALLQWLWKRLNSVAAYGGRNPWIAHVLEGLAIAAPCVLLAWWVLVELRKQPGLPQRSEPVVAQAPSAREWQRWLEEAEKFARESHWREAIHHVYWAAISRLEAHGLWPADRARTPREYLALLREGHVLKPELRSLTRSFEVIWYGHRPASEEQYREAHARMEKLVPR